MIIKLLALGFVAGLLSGLLGIGGGVIMIPALVLILDVPIKEAMGISLLAIIPTAIVGFLKCYQNGNVDLKVSFLITCTSLIGAYLGATLMGQLSSRTIKNIFGIFLLIIGLNTIFDWTGKLNAKKYEDQSSKEK